MTREELIEKIVAITEADDQPCLSKVSAREIIDIVLEDAAKTIEAHIVVPWFIDENGKGCRDDASAKQGNENIATLAAAIRALKGE